MRLNRELRKAIRPCLDYLRVIIYDVQCLLEETLMRSGEYVLARLQFSFIQLLKSANDITAPVPPPVHRYHVSRF